MIPALPLPSRLPHPRAIESFRTGPEKYEVDFWEMEYRVQRFLRRVDDAYLEWRYRSILRNLQTLVAEERDVIPLQSGLSSWYWFRKEYQTRLEFHLRGKALPLPDVALYQVRQAPAKPKHPNTGDILFRYGQRGHLLQTLAGRARLGSSESYAKIENDEARHDAEHEKRSFLSGDHARVTTMDGKTIPIIGNITRIVAAPHYYMLCLSSEWDPQLFGAFKVDSCLLIRDAEEFRFRLLEACEADLPGWLCELIQVQYFDPYEMTKNELFDSAMSKDFSFAYQQESRFICSARDGSHATESTVLTTRALGDIAELYSSS